MNVEDLGEYVCDGKMDIEDLEKERPMKTTVLKIDTINLHPHPDNPRKDVGDVSELAKSLKANGIMQNLTVFPMDDELKEYMVLIGHRRLAAAKAAGIDKVPCNVIYEDIPSRAKQIEIMLEENMQRNDLTPYEEAESFQLCLDLGETVEDLANKTGFSKTTIKRRVEMAKLDREAVKSHSEGGGSFQLTLSDYYALEKIPDVEGRNQILAKATSPQQLHQLIAMEVTTTKKKKVEEELETRFIAMGIEKVRKGLENSYFDTDKLEEAWSVDTVNAANKPELIKDIVLKEKKPWHGKACYMFRYSRAYVYYEVNKKKKQELMPKPEPTASQLAEKERDNRKRKLRELKKECMEHMRRCVMNVITGKIQRPKSIVEMDLIRALWEIAIRRGSTALQARTMWEMHDYGYGEDWYASTSTVEGKKKVQSELDEITQTLPISYQMMLMLVYEFKTVEFWDWQVNYYESDNTACVRDFVTILMQFGFVPSKEHRQLICGTHELYTKKEEK